MLVKPLPEGIRLIALFEPVQIIPAFIKEMPLHHIPNARTISLYVWHNTWAFVKKAGTIILLASAIVWLFAYLSDGDVQGSILARFGHWPCIATVTAIKQETGA